MNAHVPVWKFSHTISERRPRLLGGSLTARTYGQGKICKFVEGNVDGGEMQSLKTDGARTLDDASERPPHFELSSHVCSGKPEVSGGRSACGTATSYEASESKAGDAYYVDGRLTPFLRLYGGSIEYQSTSSDLNATTQFKVSSGTMQVRSLARMVEVYGN